MEKTELVNLVMKCLKDNSDKIFLRDFEINSSHVLFRFLSKKKSQLKKSGDVIFLNLKFNMKYDHEDTIEIEFGLFLHNRFHRYLSINIYKACNGVKSLAHLYIKDTSNNLFYPQMWLKTTKKHRDNKSDRILEYIKQVGEQMMANCTINDNEYKGPYSIRETIKNMFYSLEPVFNALQYKLDYIENDYPGAYEINIGYILFKPIIRRKQTLFKNFIRAYCKEILKEV